MSPASRSQKKASAKVTKLRPAKSKTAGGDGAAQFSLQQEMLQLLQRVRGNKSKRTATALVERGPIRAFMVALDKGATLEQDAIDGNVTVQCLIGEAEVSVGRAKKRLHVGDLLVLKEGSARGVEAVEPAALLITIAARVE
jgi:quercetin dioxygenase-like cupin family protein